MTLKKAVSCAFAMLIVAALVSGCASTDKRLYGEWVDDYESTTYGFGNGLQGYTSWQGMSMPIVYMLENDLLVIAIMDDNEVTEMAAGGDKEAAIRRHLQNLGQEDKMEYGLTFFGDHEFVLESPPQSGNQQRFKRRSQQEQQAGY